MAQDPTLRRFPHLDEVLLARFYAGDDSALDALAARYRGTISEHSRGLDGRPMPHALVLAWLGFWEAVAEYDPADGTFRAAFEPRLRDAVVRARLAGLLHQLGGAGSG